MSSSLLAAALSRDGKCNAAGIRSAELLKCLADAEVHVVVIGADVTLESKNGFELAQAVRRVHPSVPIVMLLSAPSQESVVSAFQLGARGVFSRERPIAEFISCVEHVRNGSIWAGAEESNILLDLVASIQPAARLTERESLSLTSRELQVVQCVLSGKTNKATAKELHLSEHTVKNYLFRVFEKLGVSNRVELLLHLAQTGHIFNQPQSEEPVTEKKAG
jgi:two-component system, NarL family, nitrate/nitrite response regulator NarL